jgi:hypothetical protein
MIDLNKIGQNPVREQDVVPVRIDDDYTHEVARDNTYVDLTVERGAYAGLMIRVPTAGLGLLQQHNHQRVTEFHYDYTILQLWDSVTEDQFDGRNISLTAQDQNFLHSMVFNFFDNIKRGNVRGLRLMAG